MGCRSSYGVRTVARAWCVIALIALGCPQPVRACYLDPGCSVSVGCANTSPNGSHISGTDGSVSGFWGASKGLKRVELWVGGSLRYSQVWTSGYPTTWGHAVPFSTTQWADATRVEFKAKVWDTLNATFVHTKYYDSYNRAYCIWNTDCPYGDECAAQADSACARMNHSAPGPYGDHQRALIIANIPGFTVFTADTHGGPGAFWDCPNLEAVVADEVAAAVAQKTGNQCAYNFVLICSCYSAANDSLYQAFRTRCFLGWPATVSDSPDLQGWSDVFWSELENKYSIAVAWNEAHSRYQQVELSRHYGDALYYLHKTY